ncbi:uncharacterized protein LOC142564455 [Dermacentor variabilis]|uniref:uncharacterized protein LOC142564455 n=1 Tax=Dermacentor variabilis TaxID=34621 RepID=UPI003F5C1668
MYMWPIHLPPGHRHHARADGTHNRKGGGCRFLCSIRCELRQPHDMEAGEVRRPFQLRLVFRSEPFFTAKMDIISGSLFQYESKSFPEYFWIYFKLLFPNSYPNNKAPWFRLLVGIWLLSLVVIMGLLNCTLTSTMLVRKTTDYVDSFEDLLRFPKVKIATEKLTYFSRLLKDPVGETFSKLSSRHQQVVGIYQAGPVLESVMDDVLKKKRVMIGTDVMLKSHIADHFVKTGTCRHHVTRGIGGTMNIVMLLRKTLPKEFKRKLDRFITHVNECHAYHKEMEWRLRNYTMCQNEKDDGIKPLVMVDLQGGFLLLVVGLGASLLALFVECAFATRTIRRRTKRQTTLGNAPVLTKRALRRRIKLYR